jgi:hypothetical protein
MYAIWNEHEVGDSKIKMKLILKWKKHEGDMKMYEIHKRGYQIKMKMKPLYQY